MMQMNRNLLKALVLGGALFPFALLADGADSDPSTVEIKVTFDADGGGVIDDGETSETFSNSKEYSKKLGEAVARHEVKSV